MTLLIFFNSGSTKFIVLTVHKILHLFRNLRQVMDSLQRTAEQSPSLTCFGILSAGHKCFPELSVPKTLKFLAAIHLFLVCDLSLSILVLLNVYI